MHVPCPLSHVGYAMPSFVTNNALRTFLVPSNGGCEGRLRARPARSAHSSAWRSIGELLRSRNERGDRTTTIAPSETARASPVDDDLMPRRRIGSSRFGSTSSWVG